MFTIVKLYKIKSKRRFFSSFFEILMTRPADSEVLLPFLPEKFI